jgi:hypothetical protein
MAGYLEKNRIRPVGANAIWNIIENSNSGVKKNAAGRTSQIVRILSILRHLNRGHIVKLISTSPRPKSKPPGNRAMTSRLASPSFLGLASSLMRSPALGAGWANILEI